MGDWIIDNVGKAFIIFTIIFVCIATLFTGVCEKRPASDKVENSYIFEQEYNYCPTCGMKLERGVE